MQIQTNQKMIDDVLALEQNLLAAFHNNDNAGAIEILKQLSQAKKDGHDEFKKD